MRLEEFGHGLPCLRSPFLDLAFKVGIQAPEPLLAFLQRPFSSAALGDIEFRDHPRDDPAPPVADRSGVAEKKPLLAGLGVHVLHKFIVNTLTGAQRAGQGPFLGFQAFARIRPIASPIRVAFPVRRLCGSPPKLPAGGIIANDPALGVRDDDTPTGSASRIAVSIALLRLPSSSADSSSQSLATLGETAELLLAPSSEETSATWSQRDFIF